MLITLPIWGTDLSKKNWVTDLNFEFEEKGTPRYKYCLAIFNGSPCQKTVGIFFVRSLVLNGITLVFSELNYL